MRKSIKPILLSDNHVKLPDPRLFDAQGLVAIGGDLSAERLLEAYQKGIFPWYEEGQPILWWSPDPRMVLYPASFKVSRSLKQALKKNISFSIDTAFTKVIQACASVGDRKDQTWITSNMIDAYTHLHQLGYAHSFEVWQDNVLIGGLYGVSLGRAFFGESMFHHVRDASKMAFHYLALKMKAWHFDFIDCQLPTEHLQSLGAISISRDDFLNQLQKSLNYPTKMREWR